MKRKGQTEIAGLIVVVILVTLGIFFSIALRDNNTNPEPIDVYSNEKLTSDFLIAFLETYDAACKASIQELSLDCVRKDVLGTAHYSTCTNDDPCGYVKIIAQTIIDSTLEAWGKDYELQFVFTQSTNNPILFSVGNEGCTEFSERSAPGIQPLPSPRGVRGTPYYQLDLCTP